MLAQMPRASITRSALLAAVTLAAVTPTCAPDSRALPPCDASPALPNVAPGAAVVTVAAVGDIADCAGGSQMAVATTIEGIKPDAVFALGDLAYPNANIDELVDCYGPSLGRFRSITRASSRRRTSTRSLRTRLLRIANSHARGDVLAATRRRSARARRHSLKERTPTAT